MTDEEPQIRRYRARVRLGARNDFGVTPPWEDVEAHTASAAACIVVARGFQGRVSTSAVGRLPVEVTLVGTVDVQRFFVEYSIDFKAVEGE